jgi:hypothetical protein
VKSGKQHGAKRATPNYRIAVAFCLLSPRNLLPQLLA